MKNNLNDIESASSDISRRSFLCGALAVAGAAGAAALTGCTSDSDDEDDDGEDEGSADASGSSDEDDEEEESAEEEVEEEDAELTPITFVLDWTPNTNHTGVYVAQALGYYEEAGLEVEIVQGPDDGADAIVASGEADFGVSFRDTMANYLSSGEDALPVTAVAAVIQHNTSGIVSLAEKEIDSPADMCGHTYATWELPIEQGIIQACVEEDGGDFSEVELVPSTVTDEVTALQNDQVDTIWIYWAWAGVKCDLAELDTNFFNFADIDDVFDFYTPVIIANNDLIESDPDTVQAFVDATKRGYEYCISDPDSAAEILLEAAPELDEDLVYASQEYLADKYQDDAESWGVIDQTRWDAFFTWVSDEGLAEEFEAGSGMTNDFISA